MRQVREFFSSCFCPGDHDDTNSSVNFKEDFGFKLLEEGCDPVVDIVAVHGLNGNRDKTWTARNGKNWLRDFLPKDLPNARIFTWGYGAHTHSRFDVSQQSLDDHARNLFKDFYYERKEDKPNTDQRPIIFVAHSLGGIIVKKALIYADETKETRAIKSCTYGIIFMGTPHRGGDKDSVALGKIMIKLSSLFVSTNITLLLELERHANVLRNTETQYGPIADAEKYKTIFAFEERRTMVPIVGRKMVVPLESAVITGRQNSEQLAINADHRGMVRFRSKGNQGYLQISQRLKAWTEEAPDGIAAKHQKGSQGTEVDFSVTFAIPDVKKAECFVGRKLEMQQIHQKLQSEDEQSVVVLHGLGGMGKTQLAFNYVCEHKNDYTAVFWLNSTDPDALKRSFVAAAKRIAKEHKVPELPSLNELDPVLYSEKLDQIADEANDQTTERVKDRAVAGVKDFLSKRGNTRWLLIFDIDTSNFWPKSDVPPSFAIDFFFPEAYQGAILITSRSSSLGIGYSIPLNKLSDPKECLAILSQTSQRQKLEQEDDGALKLVEKLDGLPLALASAGGLLGKTAMSFAEYLQAYEESWLQLQEIAPKQQSYHGSLYATWNLSLNYVKRSNPRSEDLLQLWAYFDNQDIWFELLQAGRDDKQPEWFREVTGDYMKFTKVMQTICDHALAAPSPTPPREDVGSGGYTMHACVHEWTKNVLHNKGQWNPDRAKLAWSCLTKHIPSSRWETRKYWPLQQRLSKHINRCLEIMREIPTEYDDLSTADSMHALGNFYFVEGKRDVAEELYERALRVRKEALAADDELTLRTLNNLAKIYSRQEKLVKAEELSKRVLMGKENKFGRSDSFTFSTIMSLGHIYRDQGRLHDAEREFLRALHGYKNHEDHGEKGFSTMTAVRSLGTLYRDQGRLLEAEEFLQRAWRGFEIAAGDDHHATLHTVREIAILYKRQGKIEEAEKKHQLIRHLCLKSDGANEDLKLEATKDLGVLYRDQGWLLEANDFLERAWRGLKVSDGPSQSSTLGAAWELGLLYEKQGRADEAEKIHWLAAQESERTFGKNDRSTLNAVRRLGHFYRRRGNLVKAEEQYQRALEGFEALGADDISTLDMCFDLGNLYRAQVTEENRQWMLAKAKKMYWKAKEGYGETRGPKDRWTIWAVHRLCDIYVQQGRLEQAEELKARAAKEFFLGSKVGQLRLTWKENVC